MRNETKRLIKAMLKDYPHLKKKIARRNEELMHPYVERDENVGGGRAENKERNPTMQMIITLDDDRAIHTMQREHEVITRLLDAAGDTTATIIKQCYIDAPYHSIKQLVATGKVWCSVTKAYKLRDQFFSDVAKELNIYDL